MAKTAKSIEASAEALAFEPDISDCDYNCDECNMRDGCHIWENEKNQNEKSFANLDNRTQF